MKCALKEKTCKKHVHESSRKFTENSRSLYETSTKCVWGEYQKKEVKVKKLLLYLQTQNYLSKKISL